MRSDLIVVDNFYADPDAIRRYAERQPFYHPYQDDQAIAAGREAPKWLSTRFRDALDCPFKSSEQLQRVLARLTAEPIDVDHWRRPFPVLEDGKADMARDVGPRSCLWNCSFHWKPATDQRLGEGVHNHVTDTWNSVGHDGWAGIIYLDPNAPASGGLHRWSNRDPRRNFDWMSPADHWEAIDTLGNVFNRLILSRGDIPHSGAAGWGKDRTDARFFQTFFFQTCPASGTPGLSINL